MTVNANDDTSDGLCRVDCKCEVLMLLQNYMGANVVME